MKRKKKLTAGNIVGIVVTGLLLIGVIVCAAWALTIANSKEILPNVTAAGIELGGMSETEAAVALEEYVAQVYGTRTLTVSLNDPTDRYDRTYSLEPETIGAKMNVSEVVAEAAAYGKSGSILDRLLSWWSASTDETSHVITTGISVDEASIRKAVHSWAAEVAIEMEPCSWTRDEITGDIIVSIGQTGYGIDEETLTKKIVSCVLDNDFRGIAVDYARTLFPVVDLSEVYHEVHLEMTDAHYDSTIHEIVPEKVGYGFDLEAATQQILLADDGSTVVIAMAEIQPLVTKADLERVYFADQVGYYETSGLGNSNRTTNIKLACESLNGLVIEPGDTFSYNQALGQRTAEKGYKVAGAYVNGKSVKEVGGGICQVSTTLYNAVLLANLEIVARSEHIYAASYVPLGMDATVSWGGPDFQFRNNTEYPIRIQAKVDGSKIKITLLGTSTGVTVKMRHETLTKIPYTTITTTDPEEVNDTGRTGYNVVTYRDVYDRDGNLISSVVEDYSYYSKMDIVVLESDLQKEVEKAENEG